MATISGPASFSRVYAATRLQLRQAALAPGTQILVNQLASAHRVSATPVREALAKLAGEKLVEDRERFGYFVPLLCSIDLVGLLELLELYVLRATVEGRKYANDVGIARQHEIIPAGDDTEARLMMRLASYSKNQLLIEEVRRCLDRSAFARHRDTELFGAPEDLEQLRITLEQKQWQFLGRIVRSHYRGTCKRADVVAHSMAAAYRENIARK